MFSKFVFISALVMSLSQNTLGYQLTGTCTGEDEVFTFEISYIEGSSFNSDNHNIFLYDEDNNVAYASKINLHSYSFVSRADCFISSTSGKNESGDLLNIRSESKGSNGLGFCREYSKSDIVINDLECEGVNHEISF